MEAVLDFFSKKITHQVYGIESHGLDIFQLESFLSKEQGIESIFSKEYDSFFVSDAKEIKRFNSEVFSGKKLVIFSFNSMNRESQNSFLKTLEEANKNIIYILVFPQRNKILETLRSRMEIISAQKCISEKERLIDLDEYLKKNLFEKFEYHKKMSSGKKNPIKKKDIQIFFADLEIYLRKNSLEKNKSIFRVILELRSSLSANGASVKNILDTLAIAMH